MLIYHGLVLGCIVAFLHWPEYTETLSTESGIDPAVVVESLPVGEAAKLYHYLQDASVGALRIELAKNEILHKLGMTKRPPKMHELKANIPKPVFDGEISSLFSDQTHPARTTQIVVPSEIGLCFFVFIKFCRAEVIIMMCAHYYILEYSNFRFLCSDQGGLSCK